MPSGLEHFQGTLGVAQHRFVQWVLVEAVARGSSASSTAPAPDSSSNRDASTQQELHSTARHKSMKAQLLSEYGVRFENGNATSLNKFSCEPNGQGKETCLCLSTDRVRFQLFPSTVWAGREYGLDWLRVRIRYPLR